MKRKSKDVKRINTWQVRTTQCLTSTTRWQCEFNDKFHLQRLLWRCLSEEPGSSLVRPYGWFLIPAGSQASFLFCSWYGSLMSSCFLPQIMWFPISPWREQNCMPIDQRMPRWPYRGPLFIAYRTVTGSLPNINLPSLPAHRIWSGGHSKYYAPRSSLSLQECAVNGIWWW